MNRVASQHTHLLVQKGCRAGRHRACNEPSGRQISTSKGRPLASSNDIRDSSQRRHQLSRSRPFFHSCRHLGPSTQEDSGRSPELNPTDLGRLQAMTYGIKSSLSRSLPCYVSMADKDHHT